MVEKIKRDVRITTIYEGTSEIMEMTIGRDRWQQHLKTRGRHYHDRADELDQLALAYAITVHKSQGSEYRHAALVIPPAQPDELTPLVTRELIYTAVTRAREQLTLACSCEALCAGLARRVQRETGLAARLKDKL